MLFRTYVKRLKMEALLKGAPQAVALPAGYTIVPWDGCHPADHAELLYHAFHDSLDATIFPSFRTRAGCASVVANIVGHESFCSPATLLLEYRGDPVAAVQAIRHRQPNHGEIGETGEIQNIAVLPSHRRHGLGRILMSRACRAFQELGCKRVHLDVCAKNVAAVRFYHALGFQTKRTQYIETKSPVEEYTI
jgi:ribosomal protein S18 acetylase RimI-like enzyme